MSNLGYRVDRVHVERVFSLGAFETLRLRLEAEVFEGSKAGDVARALDAEIVAIRNGSDGVIETCGNDSGQGI